MRFLAPAAYMRRKLCQELVLLARRSYEAPPSSINFGKPAVMNDTGAMGHLACKGSRSARRGRVTSTTRPDTRRGLTLGEAT